MKRMPLRSPVLNDFLGGGLEAGVITNIYGPSGSAKTAFALEATVSCLEQGGGVIFIDTEGGFSPERFLQMSDKKHLEKLLLHEPKSFDQQEKAIRELKKLVEKEKIGLIVVDSAVSLYRLERADGDINEMNRRLAKQLASLSRLAREKKIPVLITNQVYSDFDTGELELVGRDIPKYWSKCLVLLEKLEWGRRKATLVKHRSMPEGVAIVFDIKDEGLVESKKRLGVF